MPDVTPVLSPSPTQPPSAVSQLPDKPATTEPATVTIPAGAKPRVRPTPVTKPGPGLPNVVSPSIEKNGKHTAIRSLKDVKADAITQLQANKELSAADIAYLTTKVQGLNAKAVVIDVHLFEKTGQGKDAEWSMIVHLKGNF